MHVSFFDIYIHTYIYIYICIDIVYTKYLICIYIYTLFLHLLYKDITNICIYIQ